MKKESLNTCEYCMHYGYDDEYECYVCEIDLDMDEYERFATNAVVNCPYYRGGDEYTIVRKQN
ncbi:MAG: hypothetical protein IJB86_11015 [Clostridia bacterium]|nr:hypothetical protein [Clostridia bacterium]